MKEDGLIWRSFGRFLNFLYMKGSLILKEGSLRLVSKSVVLMEFPNVRGKYPLI